VFLPVDGDYIPEHEGPQPLRHYYFHQPRPVHQMRAWRKTSELSNIVGAGHILSGSEFRLAAETLALRHYIFRNQAHAFEKYARRLFAAEEDRRGWHANRIGQSPGHFTFPPPDGLVRLARPHVRHPN